MIVADRGGAAGHRCILIDRLDAISHFQPRVDGTDMELDRVWTEIEQRSQKALPLATVGRRLVDDPVAFEQVQAGEALTQLAGLGVA